MTDKNRQGVTMLPIHRDIYDVFGESAHIDINDDVTTVTIAGVSVEFHLTWTTPDGWSFMWDNGYASIYGDISHVQGAMIAAMARRLKSIAKLASGE